MNKAPLEPLKSALDKANETQRRYVYSFAQAIESLDLPENWTEAGAVTALLEMYPELRSELVSVVSPESLSMADKLCNLPRAHVTAIEALESAQPHQQEGLRQMFLSLIDDIRIMPLFLTRPMAWLKTFRDTEDQVVSRLGREILVLHAPLANRFGIWQLKWQLEDLAFRLINPDAYHKIANALAERRETREYSIRRIESQIKDILARAGIKAIVSGRPKHLYSIWKKMQRKDCTIDTLSDLLGFRIIVSDVRACYAALGAVHAFWSHVSEEFDDYIASPKTNLYRSIHTVIVPDIGRPTEIQIRTYDMHREAELGVAAHWKYKEHLTSKGPNRRDVAKLREMLNKAVFLPGEHCQSGQLRLSDQRIYALTPAGRIIALSPGASPLDFAYAVHTELGHHTVGAKVNGRLVPLTHKLRSGDIVEVMTRNSARPSPDWLRQESGYVVTKNGQRKLRSWFSAHSGDNISGPELIDVHSKSKIAPARNLYSKPQRKHTERPIVEGVLGLSVSIANCCHPSPNDPIGALLTNRRGIRIHSQRCHFFKTNASYRPEHILAASWTHQK